MKKLQKKNTDDSLLLDEEQLVAFQMFIDKICSPYSVDTGASSFRIERAFSESIQMETRKTISYCSRPLLPVENSYYTSDNECLSRVGNEDPLPLHDVRYIHCIHGPLSLTFVDENNQTVGSINPMATSAYRVRLGYII